MDTNLLSISCLLFIVSVLNTYLSSVSIDCYDKNPEYKKNKDFNYNTIIYVLVSAVLALILSIVGIYMAVKAVGKILPVETVFGSSGNTVQKMQEAITKIQDQLNKITPV